MITVLSQGFVNLPFWVPKRLNVPQIIRLVYHLGDIMLIRPGKQERADILEALAKHMCSRGCR